MKKADFLFSLLVGVVIVIEPGLVSSQAWTMEQEAESRVIPLPELEKPRQICAENQQVYIVDDRDILVYSLADGSLLRRIGKRGQGPGEFAMGPFGLTIFPDRLVVKDFRKILFFSHDGGRIYVVTSDQKNGLYEVIVMDTRGKILERSYRFPLAPNFYIPEDFKLGYDVEGDSFIWFAYNDAKEYYELHIY